MHRGPSVRALLTRLALVALAPACDGEGVTSANCLVQCGVDLSCPSGMSCETDGFCHAPGSPSCAPDAGAPDAGPPACVPAAEICNGVDDDCDGQVDEGFPQLGQACDGPDLDPCSEGTWVCDGSGGVVCGDTTQNSVETCNRMDDDCDGQVDDGLDRTYQKSTGPAANGSTVCCDAGDTLISIADCGDGNNHGVRIQNQCGVALEGSENFGSPCAAIVCTGACVP